MKKITLFTLLFGCLAFSQDFSVRYSLTNSLPTDLTDYQVLIEVDTQTLISNGDMQANCDDIRFIPTLGSSDHFDYWIESGCNTTNTRIWVEVDLIPSGVTDIFMTYGDLSATAMSNGENTFLFFDDFSSGIVNMSKWNGFAFITANIDNTIGEPSIPSAKIVWTDQNMIGLNSTLIPSNNIAVHSTFYDSGFSALLENTMNRLVGPNIFLGVPNGTVNNYFADVASLIDTGVPRTVGWHHSELYFSNNMAKVILDRGAYASALTPTSAVTTQVIQFYSRNLEANFDTIFIRNWEVDIQVTEGETLSINQFNPEPKIVLYPNPTSDKFVISGVSNSKIKIHDSLGRQIILIDNYNEDYINVSDLKVGLYFVHIDSKDFNIIKKIIVNND